MGMMRSAIFVFSSFLLIWSFAAGAQTPGRLQLKNPSGGDVRALVIGIDQYQHVRPLKGAVSDARDVSQTLRAMGVSDLTLVLDADAKRSEILHILEALQKRTQK